MARQLRTADVPLVVWSRDSSACTALEAEAADGGPAVTVAASPKDVVEACERTYVMLPTPDACHELCVLLRPNRLKKAFAAADFA
eukprot:927037-Prymnesium_polylepis.1